MPMRNPQLVAALFAGLLATACGPTADSGATNDRSAEAFPTGAHQLVLRMDYRPGFARVPENAPLPAFSLYGDGRIVVADQDPNAPASPGGWQRARELRTDPAGVQRLLAAARAAGLVNAPESSGSPPTAPDAPATRFLLLDDNGQRHSITGGVPGAESGALGELFRALSDPADWLGESRTTPYRADALAVLRRDESSPVPGAQQWPLGSLAFPGTRLGSGQRAMTCTVLRGEPAATLTAKAAGTAQYSQWTDGQHTATLELRPLLPDENDCRDLDVS